MTVTVNWLDPELAFCRTLNYYVMSAWSVHLTCQSLSRRSNFSTKLLNLPYMAQSSCIREQPIYSSTKLVRVCITNVDQQLFELSETLR